MKLMVIDGNSIVNRSFYGVRPLTTRDGLYTNAVYGFVTTLQRLLEEEKPEALCVTFDRREPTFRHLEYEGYKAQRKGMPEELALQMPWTYPATSWRDMRRTTLSAPSPGSARPPAGRAWRSPGTRTVSSSSRTRPR